MGTGKLNAGGNPVMDYHSIQGGVGILLTSCYRNQDKPWPGGPLNSYADLLSIKHLKPSLVLCFFVICLKCILIILLKPMINSSMQKETWSLGWKELESNKAWGSCSQPL